MSPVLVCGSGLLYSWAAHLVDRRVTWKMRSFDAEVSEIVDDREARERERNVLVGLQIAPERRTGGGNDIQYADTQTAASPHYVRFLARARTSCQESSATI